MGMWGNTSQPIHTSVENLLIQHVFLFDVFCPESFLLNVSESSVRSGGFSPPAATFQPPRQYQRQPTTLAALVCDVPGIDASLKHQTDKNPAQHPSINSVAGGGGGTPWRGPQDTHIEEM